MSMRAEGISRVRPAPLPIVLPAHLQKFSAEYQRIRPGLQGFLDRYHQERFILLRETRETVSPTLEACLPGLEEILGEAFLGLSLGGSRVLGLETPLSDVDFFIYTIGSLPEQEQEAIRYVSSQLVRADLRPCLRANRIKSTPHYVYNFVYNFEEGKNRPFDYESVASVFTSYFIGAERNQRLVDFAVHRAKRLYRESLEFPSVPKSLLESDYFKFLGVDIYPWYVVARYLMMNGYTDEHGCYCNDLLSSFLHCQAVPYLEARRSNFPFPPQLEAALEPEKPSSPKRSRISALWARIVKPAITSYRPGQNRKTS